MARSFSGQLVRERREALGLSREALAIAIGRTLWTIYGYETGRARPGREALEGLAEALDCSPGAFFAKGSSDAA